MPSLREVLDSLGQGLSQKAEAFKRALENIAGRALDEASFLTGTDEMLREAAGILSEAELDFLRQKVLEAQQIYLDSLNQEVPLREQVAPSPTGSQMVADQLQKQKDKRRAKEIAKDQETKLKAYNSASSKYDNEASKSSQYYSNPAKYIKENH